MIWFIFAILSGFFDATYYMLVKKWVKNVDKHVLASGAFFSGGVILFIISWTNGLPEIGDQFFYGLSMTVLLNFIAAIIYFSALKFTDLSLAIPMLAFSPLFLIGTSFLLLGELPSLYGVAGILLIVVGAYVLNTIKGSKDILLPFKRMVKERGIFMMIFVALLYSFSANYDKITVVNSNPLFGSAAILLSLGIAFFIMAHIRSKDVGQSFLKHRLKFIALGGVFSLVILTANTALTLQIVPYVISLKRLSILFGVIYGGLLFKEKDLVQRLVAVAIMLTGVVIILFLG